MSDLEKTITEKETPISQTRIDLMHIAMGQIENHAKELERMGRITEEEHRAIAIALNNLGDTIADILHPEKLHEINFVYKKEEKR